MAPRKSKRSKKSERVFFTTQAVENSGNTLQSPTLTEERAVVQGKKSAAFYFFDEVPLDIFGEVLRLLNPLDLLHLARTSKSLRQVLMDPVHKVFWMRSAAGVLGLPPCPKDLTEPQYADLMFSDHCHKCFREDTAIYAFMEARTQLCGECSLVEFKRWKELPEAVDEALSEFVPATSERLTKAEQKLTEIQASAKWRIAARTRFHVNSAMKLHREHSTLKRTGHQVAWFKKQHAVWHELDEHASACKVFVQSQIQNELERSRISKCQREQSIRQKLIELGWEFEYFRYGMLRDVPKGPICRDVHLNQEKELTEQEWDEMKDDMVEWMEGVREAWNERLRSNRISDYVDVHITPAYSAFVASQPPDSLFPTLAEVAFYFLPFLEGIPLDSEAALPEGLFDAAAQLPEVVANWKDKLQDTLLAVIHQAETHAQATKEVLPYATTQFQCRLCRSMLAYPTVGLHGCFFKPYSQLNKKRRNPKAPTSTEREPQTTLRDDFFRTRFSGALIWLPGTAIELHEGGYRHAVMVLDCLRLEHTTTAKDLFALNPYLECLCKCYGSTVRTAMRVRQALGKCYPHLLGKYEQSFAPIDEAFLQGFHGYQAESQAYYDIYCAWCHEHDHYFSDMSSHLMAAHGMDMLEATTNKAKHILRVEYYDRSDTIISLGAVENYENEL